MTFGPVTTLHAALRAVLSRVRPDGTPHCPGARPFSAAGIEVSSPHSNISNIESLRHVVDAWKRPNLRRQLGRRGGWWTGGSLFGQLILQSCVSKLVNSSDRAQNMSIPGVFEEGHQGDDGNAAGTL